MKKNSQYASLDNVQISKKHIEHKYYNKRPIRGYRVSNIQSNFERDNAPLYNTIQTEVNNSKNIFNNNFSSGKYTPYINRDNVYRDYYQMHTYQPNESEEIKDFSKTSMHLNPFSLFSQSNEKQYIINNDNNNENSEEQNYPSNYSYHESKCIKTEKFKNINENYLYAKTRYHHVINKYYNKNESKGKEKVKEYDKVNGQLKFEGEYLNAEKSGKGIEYDFVRYYGVNTLFIVFEGDYLNGKRNGKGKEYKYRDLIFEGEYRDGKRNGKGKEYNNGNLIFEGEYLDGKKWNGMEKIYNWGNKLLFERNYLEGRFNGNIKEYYENGQLKFEGEYLDGKKNGKGKEYNYDGKLKFEGEYKNGLRHGKGKDYNDDGKVRYESEYAFGNLLNIGKVSHDNLNINEYYIKSGFFNFKENGE